ncbi:MAG: DUF3857 domain-containing protein [Candidatus Omnitrophota bacterium]
MKKILYIICIIPLLISCSQPLGSQEKLKKADFYASQGQEYIQTSINLYKELIKEEEQPKLKEDMKIKLGDLYLDIGKYKEAVDCFLNLDSNEAKKKLAIAYFKNSQQSDALAQFQRLGELNDGEYLYFYGQALEKHNLYDKALEIYSLIPGQAANYTKAQERINAINLSEDKLLSENINEILESAPNQSDYPNAGAVVLLAEESFEMFEDNTAVFDMHYIVKILNDRGKEDYSELHIGYDSTFEDVQLDYARTIKPDGSAVYVGDKSIRDVSIYLNFPLYSNARARIISMPEVSEGAVIEYRAKILRKQLVNKKDFRLEYGVQDVDPIKTAKFQIKIPKDRDFSYKIINSQYNTFSANLEPEKEIIDNKKIFSWHMENIPEMLPEPNMPPTSRINPIIMMSTFKSWQDIYAWWYDLYKDKIKIDKNIQDKITELTEDLNSPLDKLRAIHNFCAQDIRYVAIEYGQAGYEPHEAIDVFKNKYGDCKDQAILLIAMLRHIGIDAYPVLIGKYDHINLNEDFPSIPFDHCIAVVNFEGEWIFMDPTAKTVPFRNLPGSDQDRMVFVVLDDGYKIVTTPLFESQNNSSQTIMQIKIKEDHSIYVKRKVNTGGVFEHGQRYWLQFTKPELIKDTLVATANGLAPGAKLIKHNIENAEDLDKDVILEYEFQAPEYLSKAGTSRLLPQYGEIDISPITKDKRNYPIEYPVPFETNFTMEIELPTNLSLKFFPENINVDSKWFKFENIYSQKDNKIIFSEKYKLKERIVSLQEYLEYKHLVEDIARKTNQRIILEEK